MSHSLCRCRSSIIHHHRMRLLLAFLVFLTLRLTTTCSPLTVSYVCSPVLSPVHLPPCSQRLLLCLLTPLLAPTIGCVVPLMLATCLPFPYPFYALLFSPPGIPPPSILPSPPLSSLAVSSPPFSDFLHAARRTVSRVLSSLVTDSTSPPRSVLAEFTSVRRLDYATQLVSAPARPPLYLARGGRLLSFLLSHIEDYQSLGNAAHRAQHDCKLHALDFSTAFLEGSLHEQIFIQCAPDFTGSYLPVIQWSLQQLVYCLRQAPREWHATLRTTLADLRLFPTSADRLSLFALSTLLSTSLSVLKTLSLPIQSEGLGFESQCVHFGHPSAGGCQRSTGDPRLILGKGYRLVVLGGYGRTDPLLNKPFYPNGLVVGILTGIADAAREE
ncbi:unnamed protein product [Closterium sp. NIES-54]